MNKKVYIVLLNYNSANHTIECISSILNSTYKNISIIVVDNDSQDDSVNIIKEYFEVNRLDYIIKTEKIKLEKIEYQNKILLIKSNTNGGFACGNNIALEYIIDNIENGYVWILNNDTYVDKFAVENLVKSTKEDVLMGGVLVDYKDRKTIQTVGGFRLNNYLGIPKKYYKGVNINKFNPKKSTIKLDMISGASMFMSIKTLIKIGLMPEEYFMYWEDTDWCYTAKNKGITLDFCDNAIIYHKEGGSIGNRSYNQIKLDFRNMLYFYKKNNQKYIKVVILNKLFINIISSMKNRFKLTDAINASLDGIKEFNLRIKNNV